MDDTGLTLPDQPFGNTSHKCAVCDRLIPERRLQALPTARTCVDCSSTGRVAGFQVISSKTTYTELQLVEQDQAQMLYQMQDRKGSSVATGVLFKELPPPKLSNFE